MEPPSFVAVVVVDCTGPITSHHITSKSNQIKYSCDLTTIYIQSIHFVRYGSTRLGCVIMSCTFCTTAPLISVNGFRRAFNRRLPTQTHTHTLTQTSHSHQCGNTTNYNHICVRAHIRKELIDHFSCISWIFIELDIKYLNIQFCWKTNIFFSKRKIIFPIRFK